MIVVKLDFLYFITETKSKWSFRRDIIVLLVCITNTIFEYKG